MNNENRKTAIITGGNRGLGRNTAINLARRGVDVLFTWHSKSAEAQSLIREAEAMAAKQRHFSSMPEISACSMDSSTRCEGRCAIGAGSGSITL